MKNRKWNAHINIGITKVQKDSIRGLQKQLTIVGHAKFMREALGIRRKQRYKIYLYRQRMELKSEAKEISKSSTS